MVFDFIPEFVRVLVVHFMVVLEQIIWTAVEEANAIRIQTLVYMPVVSNIFGHSLFE